MVDAIKKYNKIIISVIAVLAIFAVLPFIVKKGTNSLTERQRKLVNYDQYQDGDELVDGTDYVTFDAYFYENINGTPTKIRGEYLNINQNAELWLDLHVFGDVELKNAKLTLVNGNVKTSGYLYKSSIIPNNTNVPNGGNITLNSSIKGATLNNKITVAAKLTNDLNSLSNSTNKVVLTGTVVKPNGEEVEITKEVAYTVDWYLDDLTASIGAFQKDSQSFPYREIYGCEHATATGYVKAYYHEWTGENYKLTFKLTTTSNNPFLKSTNVEVKIPKLNGYDPISVTMQENGITYNYDDSTKTLTASREAVLDGTLFTKTAYSYRNNGVYYNDWIIIVEYPKEVEDNSETMMFPTKVWYEAYKYNDNSQIDIESSSVIEKVLTATYYKPTIRTMESLDCGQPDRVEFRYNASIGNYSSLLGTNYINKTGALKKYNNDDGATDETNYNVSWKTYIGYFDKYVDDTITSVTISDNNADTTNAGTLDGISKYKSIRVSNPGYWLGSTGYIKIIDNKTDEVIHILTALDWNDTYTFDTAVSSIRLETSELINKDAMASHVRRYGWQDTELLSLFNVSIVKTIDHNALMNTYDLATFNTMYYVGTNVKVGGVRHRTEENTDQLINNGTAFYNSASLRTLQSAEVEIDSSDDSIDSTELNDVTFTIETGDYHDIVEGYKDAEFLLALPNWILDLDINSITIDNNNVEIKGYEKVDLAGGKKGIRIETANDTPTQYKITINTTLTPDARLMNSSGNASLYATNPSTNLSEHISKDTYDVDQDGDTEEYQNYSYKAISLDAPNEVITTTTINYKDVDDNGVTVVSPMVADVNPLEDHTDAQIEIGITNNSLYPTQDFTIIGKIGFIGNTYQIGDGDLGSEFNVKMTSDGIAIPEELEGKVTIYYSDKTEPTDDINDSNNNWKTKENVADFNAIKTYMIVVDDYELPVGKNMTFTYDIEMPNTTANLNQKTYFTHGVYYNINTGEAGLLPSSVGGAKLGINMSRRYDLSLTNYKMSSDRTIAGSKYIVVSKDSNDNIIDSKLLTTDANGNAVAKNLYAGVTYEIAQTSVKNPYILDEQVKKVTLTNGENDVLSISTEGSIKSTNLVNNHLVTLNLENETRYDIVLKNTDLDTNENIIYSKFVITGKGYETPTTVVTNTEGEIRLNGLYLDEVYNVEQIKADKYLLTNSFTLRLTRDTDGSVKVTVKKIVKLGDPVKVGAYGFKLHTYSNGYWYEMDDHSNGSHTASYFPLDLTDFKENYTLNFAYRYSDTNYPYGTFKVYVTDKIVDLNQLTGTALVYKTNYIYSYDTLNINITGYNEYTPNGDDSYTVRYKALEPDKQYYIYVDLLYNYSDCYVYPFTATNSAGKDYEYIVKDNVADIETYENKYATQTVIDSDNQDSPVLMVNVKNKKIPTYTLELTKEDAESHEKLAGAQYKITGPGLPESGKYITTDDTGKTTIELQKVFNNTKVNNIDYSQVEGIYTIQEVVAPVGYTIDDKPVTFSVVLNLENGTWNNGWYETDLSTEKNNNLGYSPSTISRFKAAEFDNDNNVLKVTMHDYPIVKVVKKDAETGEVLPNTLFAIYEITTVAGISTYLPAKDVKGNVIGQDVTIDGVEYKMVSTDENGNLNLNLPAGQYILKEIQAADEKYELSDAIYSFGIGETVPHQAAGVELSDYTIINAYSYLSGGYTYVRPTSDNGWIYNNAAGRLIKYDEDLNVEWDVSSLVNRYSVHKYTYFDNPDRIDSIEYDSYYPAADVIQTTDGGFVVRSDYYPIIVKYDANGNVLWQRGQNTERYHRYDHYCTYEGNTNEEGKVAQYIYNIDTKQWEPYLTTRTDSTTGEVTNVVSYYYSFTDDMKRDDDTYYCHSYGSAGGYADDETIASTTDFYTTPGGQRVMKSFQYDYSYNSASSYRGQIVAGPNGEVYIIYYFSPGYENNYFKLSDGTIISDDDYVGHNIIERYDANGNFIGIYNLDTILKRSETEYMDKYGLTTSYITSSSLDTWYKSVYSYPNGDILVFLSDGPQVGIKLRYNATTNDFDTVYFAPVAINGDDGYANNSYRFDDNADYEVDVVLTPDGGFAINNGYGQTTITENPSSPNPYYNTELQQYDDENFFYKVTNGSISAAFALRFDGTGKVVDGRTFSSSYRWYGNSEPEYYAEGLKHIFGYLSGPSFMYIPEDDSYIVATSTNSFWTYQMVGDNASRKVVELANGDIYTFQNGGTYAIYKINNQNKIEWVKEYAGISPLTSDFYIQMRMSANGDKLIIPVGLGSTVYDITDVNRTGMATPVIQSSGGQAFIVLDLLDEVTPSGPEAYTLNIENKRKEYNITSTSNVGGEIKVTTPVGTEEVINNGTIETVKYGDDNVNTITITPDAGYVIASVKVNGEDASYTVNDDGSVTLDTIKDIKENKSINVTFEYGKSTVIVKHYLNGTTDSVFSDEIITGTITSPYSVDPKSSDLYSVASENGEIILPDNMTGTFKVEPQTVIFYYVENEVELRVNYYVDGTDTELAPTNVERKVLRSPYQTSPLEITNYELTRTIGEESGTLTQDVTEVTYMYQEITESTITIRYVDKDTNRDIIDPIVKTVTRHEPYTTDDPVELPAKYRYTSVSGVPSGNAEDANIEVIYYYEVIPFNISVDKKINSVLLNGEKQTITDGKNVSISPKKKDNLIVYYEIEVKNTGDIPATFKVVEGDIPGFEIYDKGEFAKVGNNYELNVELEPGDSKTYKIGYKWNQKDYGISTNKVEITEVTGKEGYPEPDTDDNKSTATVETKIPKEVIPDTIIIPDTVDKIMTSIIIFIGSLIGIIVSLILIKKRRMNN
ncbi:MAG: MucBP domain-containing protein [Bacilli bacterium]|nr:MucBP domain-containing protein [Bacilli bacterium]